ncbi:MAG: RAMP superfamily CRISPR-associated protein [Coriobacteriales bacterium]
MLRIRIDVDTFLMLGSGTGRGSYIDSDIIVDEEGLPIFPARRLKGLLRESALEVKEMLQQAALDGFLPLEVDKVFGTSESPSVLRINNLYPPEYEETADWIRYIRHEYKQLVSKETITNIFTDIRQQTSINKEGYAKEGSLRSIRVLKAPYTFTGIIEILDLSLKTEIETMLALACLNLRRVGSSRNRGWGAVTCTLYAENGENLGEKVLAELKVWQPGQERHYKSSKNITNDHQFEPVFVPKATYSYSHKLDYIITNHAPLIFPSADGDENMVTCLDYIPGSALHGYYANEFIKKKGLRPSQAQDDEIFKQWFLNGELGFSNALLVHDEPGNLTYSLYPVPLFIHTDKSKKNLYSLLTDEVKDTKAVGGYGCVINDGQLLRKEPEKAISFHLVRNSNTNLSKERIEGHGEDGGIFHYQFLKPEQKFKGCIWGSKETLETFKQLFDKLEIIRLGRSINTQYGTCTIKWGKIEENVVPLDDTLWEANEMIPYNQLLLYFMSPVVTYDDYGFATSSEKNLTNILEEKLGLEKDSIEIIRSFTKLMESRSFIAHWKMPEPVFRGWAAGSSFLLRFKDEINEDLQHKIQALMQEGLGEKRHLGFGQVRFFKSLPVVTDYVSRFEEEIGKPESMNPMAKRIIEKIYQDYYERIVVATANQRASEYYDKNKGKVKLSSNLLGRLERIVQDSTCQDELTDIIKTLRETALKPLTEMKLSDSTDSSLFQELTDMKLDKWCKRHMGNEAELAMKFHTEFSLRDLDTSLYKKYWQVFFRTLRKLYKSENN